jgi:ribosomal protein S19
MRSVWKCHFGIVSTNKKLVFYKRNNPIQVEHLDKIIQVHNGVRFIALRVIKEMSGLRLGAFAPTTKTVVHKKKTTKRK